MSCLQLFLSFEDDVFVHSLTPLNPLSFNLTDKLTWETVGEVDILEYPPLEPKNPQSQSEPAIRVKNESNFEHSVTQSVSNKIHESGIVKKEVKRTEIPGEIKTSPFFLPHLRKCTQFPAEKSRKYSQRKKQP